MVLKPGMMLRIVFPVTKLHLQKHLPEINVESIIDSLDYWSNLFVFLFTP